METVEKVRKPRAKWDAHAANVFNEICVQQVIANNRPNGCLNNRGYANLIAQFNERSGRNYSRAQLKNRWDSLKADYTTWKTLNLHAFGLGRDPKSGTIAADATWWAEKNAAIPGCQKFRFAPLENEDDLEIMFGGAPCTNKSAMVPGVDDLTQTSVDVADVAGESNSATTPIVNRQAKKRVIQASRPNKPKRNFRDLQSKRFVYTFEEKASSSKSSSTSAYQDIVRQEITEMLESVIAAGAEEGSDEHFYATQLLIKKEYRDVFCTLKTPGGKLAWLRRTWEERKKH